MPDGELTADNKDSANLLITYFTSVFEQEGNSPLPEFDDRTFKEPLVSIDITEDKISKIVNGPDYFHPKLMKECKRNLISPMKRIFELSLQEEKLPQKWKMANVTAIFKSGSKSKVENYRPISLTSVPGKILERIIRDEIVNHMTNKGLFSPNQHGFIKRRSCSTNLLEFL